MLKVFLIVTLLLNVNNQQTIKNAKPIPREKNITGESVQLVKRKEVLTY